MAVDIHVRRYLDFWATVQDPVLGIDDGQSCLLEDVSFEHVHRIGDEFYFPAMSKHAAGPAWTWTYMDSAFNNLDVHGSLTIEGNISYMTAPSTVITPLAHGWDIYGDGDLLLEMLDTGSVFYFPVDISIDDTTASPHANTLLTLEKTGGAWLTFMPGGLAQYAAGIQVKDTIGYYGELYFDCMSPAGWKCMDFSLEVWRAVSPDGGATAKFIVNNGKVDVDSQFKSVSLDYLLHLDASTSRVGIGTNSGDTLLHVWGGTAGAVAATAGTVLTVEDNGDTLVSILAPDVNTAGVVLGCPTSATLVQLLSTSTAYEAYRAATIFHRVAGVTHTLSYDGHDFLQYTSAGGARKFVLNDSSIDMDYIVNTLSKSNVFYIDGNTGIVKIRGNSPPTWSTAKFAVFGVGDNDALISDVATNGESCWVKNCYWDVTNSRWQYRTSTDYPHRLVMGSTGNLTFYTAILGTQDTEVTAFQDVWHIAGNGITGECVVNEVGGSRDFRVEGDNKEYLIFGKGSTDRVGINESSPDRQLHVTDSTATTNALLSLLRLTAKCSATVALGFGGALEYEVQDYYADLYVAGLAGVIFVNDGAAQGSSSFDYVISLVASGAAAAEKFRVTSGGSGKFSGTVWLGSVQSGATEPGGVGAGEVWETNSHATLPDHVLMLGT